MVVVIVMLLTVMTVAVTVNDGGGSSSVQLQTPWLQFASKPSVALSVGSRTTQTGYCRAAPLHTSHPMQKLIYSYTKTRRGLGTAGALESKCRSLMNRFKKSVRQYNLHSPWMARPII